MDEIKTLLDYAPYILGKSEMPNSKQIPRITMEQSVQFAERVHSDTVAEQLFDMCERHTDFFSMHIDARTWVPKELQAEAFYTAKNGEFNTVVPAMCVYIMRKAWKECYGIPNLIFKVIPKQYAVQFFAEGYLAPEYRMLDVVHSLCGMEYQPLSEYKRKIRHDTYSEIYVAETDMVAAVPNRIADEITDGMIDAIKVTPDGLAIGESLLRTRGGSYGITNSVYDLRELV